MTSQETLFQIRDVKKYYPIKKGVFKRTKGYVKAVNGFSLHIMEGETIGVVGESGCGKSTLGRTILGLETLTEGELIYRGEKISSLSDRALKPYRKELQMIFQNPFASLNPRQKIGNALEEPFITHTSDNSKTRKEKVISLLEEVGLNANDYKKYPLEFSGGQRQRIAIARAIALNPSFIVSDEAVSALDVSIQAQVLELLQSLQTRYHLTYLFISHDLSVVKHICNRVMVMYLGEMMELAPSETLYNHPKHPYTESLISAIPRPNPNRKREKIKLQGEIPSPVNPPKGCPFHTRCPLAIDICKEEKPAWKQVGEGHYIACHRRS